MIKRVRPNTSVKYHALTKHLDNSLEVSLVTQHPKHVVEAESHLALEKIFSAEEFQHLLLAVGALKDVAEGFFLGHGESSHDLQKERLVVSFGSTGNNLGVLGHVRREVAVGAFLGEVEVVDKLLGCVRVQGLLDRFHVLSSLKWECTLWDLIKN